LLIRIQFGALHVRLVLPAKANLYNKKVVDSLTSEREAH